MLAWLERHCNALVIVIGIALVLALVLLALLAMALDSAMSNYAYA